jgi:chromosome segregation ATPase
MTDDGQPTQRGTPDLPAPPGPGRLAPRRTRQPHLSGDLPTILDSGPAFAGAMRGYDRLQVDNYVAWAESELRAAQRVTTELVARLAANEGELHRARQLMAQSAEDRDLVRLSDRVADLLRMAVQEAAVSAEATAADAERAEDVVASARQEAEVIIRRARRLEARAAARLQAAERRIAEAQAAEEETRTAVQAMLQEAAEEQERLEAAATARLTQAEQELHQLQQLRHRARQFLRQLTCQVDATLAVLGDEPTTEFSFTGNRAATPPDAPVVDPAATDRHTARRALSA